MNEQIPEWLKQEAERKYPYQEWSENKTVTCSENTLVDYMREGFIAGALSRSGGVIDAAKELLHLHACEQEGLQSGKPTPEQWFNAVNNLAFAVHNSGESPAADKGDAIEFAEWIRIKDFRWNKKIDKWFKFGQHEYPEYTSQQLYQLFHQSK